MARSSASKDSPGLAMNEENDDMIQHKSYQIVKVAVAFAAGLYLGRSVYDRYIRSTLNWLDSHVTAYCILGKDVLI
jgi:hypothetical protein